MGLVIGILILFFLLRASAEFYLAMLPTIIGFIAATIYILCALYKVEHKDDNK